MKLDFCAVCGITTDLHHHHLEPIVMTKAKRIKTKGYDGNKQLKDCSSSEVFAFLFDQGIISDDGLITVCSYHHNILHGIIKFQLAEHNKLIKQGQQRARENGKHIGRPSKLKSSDYDRIIDLREKGFGIKAIARKMHCGVGTVYSALEKIDQGIVEELKKKEWLENNPSTFVDLVE